MASKICIDWWVIFNSMIITNIFGLIFETAFAYSFELTLRPTYLDRMQDPEQYDDEQDGQNNPEQQKEP